DGLCGLDFYRDDDLSALLADSPALGVTTPSHGSSGGMLWIRIKEDFPQSCTQADKHFEWRADKRLSTIYGRHPAGMDYALVCDAAPANLGFSEIVWPEGWELPWQEAGDTKLKQLYGEPFYTSDKGVLTGINEAYWAGM